MTSPVNPNSVSAAQQQAQLQAQFSQVGLNNPSTSSTQVPGTLANTAAKGATATTVTSAQDEVENVNYQLAQIATQAGNSANNNGPSQNTKLRNLGNVNNMI